MSIYDFDKVINRRQSGSTKWDLFDSDVLPLWVADMDFPVLSEIQTALQERIAHPFFGYQKSDSQVLEFICDWLQKRHTWHVDPEDILLIPGVVSGFNWVVSAFTDTNAGVAFNTPVYFPFFDIEKHLGINQIEIPLVRRDGRYEIDFEQFHKIISAGKTSVFLLCNPHNPVGRVFNKEELESVGEICLANDVIICSDEIHSDIVFPGQKHIPIASLSPMLAERTITLMAPSKTFNIPGLQFSFAICHNHEMREKLEKARKGMLERPNILAETAAKAAYQHGGRWLEELIMYLEDNLEFLSAFLSEHIPEIQFTKPEGTYLAWLECSALGLTQPPFEFFLNEAKVALNEGIRFGRQSSQFVRMNFGCPRTVLQEALQKMKQAVDLYR